MPYNKPKAPKPPMPPPPSKAAKADKEPLYSQINKDLKSSKSDVSECSDSVYSDVPPPSFPPPSRPPLAHSASLPARPPPPKTSDTAIKHEYDSPAEETPTNGDYDLMKSESLYGEADQRQHQQFAPALPLRSSSILAKPSVVSRGETFR